MVIYKAFGLSYWDHHRHFRFFQRREAGQFVWSGRRNFRNFFRRKSKNRNDPRINLFNRLVQLLSVIVTKFDSKIPLKFTIRVIRTGF